MVNSFKQLHNRTGNEKNFTDIPQIDTFHWICCNCSFMVKVQQLAVFLLYCLKADWSFKMNQHCHVTSESVLSFHCRESPMAFSHYDCTILFSRSMHCNFFSKISYAKVSDLLYVGNIHFFVCVLIFRLFVYLFIICFFISCILFYILSVLLVLNTVVITNSSIRHSQWL